MPVNPNFRQAVLDYGELYIAEITKQLLLNDKKATGDLIDSLDYKVTDSANEIVLEILANPYLYFVDKGIKKGGNVKLENVEQWIKARGITPETIDGRVTTMEQLTFLIARKIQRDGVEPTNVLRKAKASLLVNKQALQNVVDAGKIDVKALIKEALKNLNEK